MRAIEKRTAHTVTDMSSIPRLKALPDISSIERQVNAR